MVLVVLLVLLVASAWASSGSLGGCGENLVDFSRGGRAGWMDGAGWFVWW